MKGRKTLGPKLARNLNASEHARERLEVILSTLTGERTIPAAGEQLGITNSYTAYWFAWVAHFPNAEVHFNTITP